jgi:SAM-dependent methyltransferase
VKSPDRFPQPAIQNATPEPAASEGEGGSVGKVPIAVSEGDFSTPAVRTRTITRPRGLRTLEQSAPIVVPDASPGQSDDMPGPVAGTPAPNFIETPGVEPLEVTSQGMGDIGAAPTAAHEASAVDEFLAAPPTPEPDIPLTPAPDLVPFVTTDFEATRSSEGSIENAAVASQLRDAARAVDGVVAPPPAAEPPPPDPLADGDPLFVDIDHGPIEDAGTDAVPPTVPTESPMLVQAPPFTSEAPEGHGSQADPSALTQAAPPEEPDGGDGGLSPLAQTLANMAEAMQGDLAVEPTVDIDIADAPLVQLPPEALTVPPARPVPPPPPGQAVAVTPSAGEVARPPVPAALVGFPEALAERPRRPKRSKPWFEEVFDESYLRTLPFMTANQTLREVDFIESSLAIPKGAEVLDVGCGYGRHAIELVQRGLAVTGLDLSLPLLIRAADESQRRSVSVNFMHADMREMTFDRQFAGAYCMLTSFGYFDEESNLKVAEGIARALKPGGRLLLDVINRDYIVGDLPARVWWEGDGCVVLEEVDFNFNTNRVLTHRSVVFEDGQQMEQEISVRVYSLHEIGKLLRQAGFRVIEVSGSIPTRGHFFGANSRNLLILAERRAD